MNALGIKSNRKALTLGIKKPHSGYSHGIKYASKNESANVSNGYTNINNVNSHMLETEKMPTGIDKNARREVSKSNLERAHKH